MKAGSGFHALHRAKRAKPVQGVSCLQKSRFCFVRIIASGILAFVFLTVFCLVYKSGPIHYPDPDGATDHRWTPNAISSQATEGFSHGRTNNEGFYDLDDYTVGDQIDVLIMGSSQMEGGNVLPGESAASRLDQLMGDEKVYNIGISGHTFLICANNLANALRKYQPTLYVVLETESVSFPDQELSEVLDGTLSELSDYSGGIAGLLSKNPFLRLVYHQMSNYRSKNGTEASVNDEQGVSTELLNELLRNLAADASDSGAKLIILYHPATTVTADATLVLDGDPESVMRFKAQCAENGILFLNMSDRFKQEYRERHILPYGFANTSVGSGHLNKYGHAMIADELYQLILEDN